MHRYLCENEACIDFNGYSAQRRRWASSAVFFGDRGSLCRDRSGCFTVVSEPLRCHGRLADGQLQPADSGRSEPRAGIYLRRPAYAAEPPSRAGAFERDRIKSGQLTDQEVLYRGAMRRRFVTCPALYFFTRTTSPTTILSERRQGQAFFRRNYSLHLVSAFETVSFP